ncbi:tetratricopeptide repeat-containing diguanylate cyclase [Rheinheimera soli]|uniref:diguanylate cyclase n=1 Tax=Rheinheimera soli TaxID=443616 RepID=A0ABU1VZN6_9GAMM|nr:tetratricopeptide repeat-containing diguanylate cyclase [Rheinheimera soli]MDR7121174.1 diguanylate cyclase (GGDEF)-like protein [Rheinheimera soli]
MSSRLLELEELAIDQFAEADPQFQQLLQSQSEPELLRKVQQSYCWVIAVQDPELGLQLVQDYKNQQQDLLWQLRFLLCEGYAKEQQGKTAEAMLDYQRVLSYQETETDPELQAKALVLRGEQYAENAAYADALTDLQKAYQLELTNGTKGRQNYVANALANLYSDAAVGDYEQAISLYKKSLEHWQESGNLQGQATALFNLGGTYESAGQFELALQYLNQALVIDQKRGDAAEIAYDKRLVARVLTKLGQGEKALELLNEAISYYQSSADAQMLAYCQLSRAITYRSLKLYQNAQQDFDSAMSYFAAKPDLRFEALLYKEYALLHAEMLQWQDAFMMQQRQQQKDAEIQQQLLDQRTTRLKVQLQTEQIQREKTELEVKNAAQRQALTDSEELRFWQYLALLCALLLILAMLFLFIRQRALSVQLKDMALTDELTHLPNRRHTLALAQQLWQQWQQHQQPFSVLAADIDFFKAINDQFGHAAGDLVLQKIAYCLRQELRPADKLGRVGGEEFLILLPGTDLSNARAIAQRLCDAVAAMQWPQLQDSYVVTLSLGLAQSGKHKDFIQLWGSADAALYKAKESGRNRTEVAE